MGREDERYFEKFLESKFEGVHEAIGNVHGRIDKQDDRLDAQDCRIKNNSKYIYIGLGVLMAIEFLLKAARL